MSCPNSVEEIDMSLITDGMDEILDSDDDFAIAEYELRQGLDKEQRKMNRLAAKGYGYWLDNCYDEVDGDPAYYCKRCLQPECGKRLAKRI